MKTVTADLSQCDPSCLTGRNNLKFNLGFKYPVLMKAKVFSINGTHLCYLDFASDNST